MLSFSQEKLVRSLHRKKGRMESGLCLVEGQKIIEMAGDKVDWTFTEKDTEVFSKLVTTESPQGIAGVAHIPKWTREEIEANRTIVVLDGVQDPGNVGAILRLCLGFDASLLLVESADVTSPKVVRSSVGAMFKVPWMIIPRPVAVGVVESLGRPIYRLESGGDPEDNVLPESSVLILGSEGNGLYMEIDGSVITIPHNPALESLNVGHALAIILAQKKLEI
jgi:RNA methyltransferase, TrmH family